MRRSSTSEAQFDKLVKTYTLNPDGSQELRVQKQLTIYTHAAMNSLYGETFIVYDPAYQQLKINESYTRQVDGTIVTTPANAFVEVLPSAAANAPAYNGPYIWTIRSQLTPVRCPPWTYSSRWRNSLL